MKIKTNILKDQSAFDSIQNKEPELYQSIIEKRKKVINRIKYAFQSGQLTEEESENMLKHANSVGPDSFVCEIRNEKRSGDTIEFDLIII